MNNINLGNYISVSKLPNILTFFNVALGIAAIIFATGNLYNIAGLLIIIGAVLDRFDGKLARKYKVDNEMGKQLDSFADIITFGVAPSITIYMLSFGNSQLLGMILVIIYVACGVYRLARFNILNNDEVFVGLPITAAGFVLASLALYHHNYYIHPYMIAAGMIILSCLMICKYQVRKI